MDLDQTTLLQIRTKQVERLYGALRRETFAGISCVLASFITIVRTTPRWLWASWLLGALVCYLVRLSFGKSFQRTGATMEHSEHWYRVSVITTLIAGAVWGGFSAAVGWFADDFGFALMMFFASCLAIAQIYFAAGSVTATVGFAGLALVPPAAIALLGGDPFGLSLGFMLLAVCALIALGAVAFRPVFLEALLLRGENEQLTNHLSQRRTQVDKLNIALKTTVDKREAVELNLRRTSADLGLAEGKAKALADTLERVSPYCPVTELLNRRAFLELVEREWRRGQRNQKHLSLLLVTVDHFAEYVGTYGSRSADAVLKRVAETIRSFGKRASDSISRFSNDQFSLLLPDTNSVNSERIAEAIRNRVEVQKIMHTGAPQRGQLTVHVGVVTMIPLRSMNHDELLKRVETAVYEARFQGGNRVVAFKPLDKIKISRWSRKDDGPLNEQSLIQKLLLCGFDTKRSILKPGSAAIDQVHESEIVYAILTGHLRFTIEGSQLDVGAGDCVFIPGGTTFQVEVYGNDPVLNFIASKPD